MENNFWIECKEVIQVAELICRDKSSLEYAHLCNTAAIIEYERGHTATAWPYMLKALSIREHHYSFDDPANCDTFTNKALLLMTENADAHAFEEAEKLLRLVIHLAKPYHESLTSVLHHHYTNLGVCLNHQGMYDEALKWVDLAKEHAFNKHFEAAYVELPASESVEFVIDFVPSRCYYDHGNICYNQGNWTEAADLFERAEQIFTDENPLAPHATASQLKLGCIAMRQGKYDQAM